MQITSSPFCKSLTRVFALAALVVTTWADAGIAGTPAAATRPLHEQITKPPRKPGGPPPPGKSLPESLDFRPLDPEAAKAQIGPREFDASGEAFYRYEGTVLIPENGVSKALLWMLGQKIGFRPVIANFVAFKRDYDKIAEAAGPEHVDLPDTAVELEKLMKNMGGSTLIIAAHHENGRIIKQIQNVPENERPSYSIDELIFLAESNGVQLMFLACKAGQQAGVSGPLADLWTPEVVDRIKRALQAATYGELYAALGSKEVPGIIRAVGTDTAQLVALHVSRLPETPQTPEIHTEIFSVHQITQADIEPPPIGPPPASGVSTPEPDRPEQPEYATKEKGRYFLVIVLAVAGTLAIFVLLSRYADESRSNKSAGGSGIRHDDLARQLDRILSDAERLILTSIKQGRISPWYKRIEALEMAAAKGVLTFDQALSQIRLALREASQARSPDVRVSAAIVEPWTAGLKVSKLVAGHIRGWKGDG